MRSVAAVVMVVGLVLGRPALGQAERDPGTEVGLALGAAGANIFYVPAKATVALLGLAVGAVCGLFTGGDTRAAYAIWVPAASGTYLLTPAHLEGVRPLEFFGSDYADRPSTAGMRGEAGATVYGALYETR